MRGSGTGDFSVSGVVVQEIRVALYEFSVCFLAFEGPV